jgi:cobyrinic acid a,c-diamide synthase
LKEDLIFERHLGLLPPQEHDEAGRIIEKTRKIVRRYLDTDDIVKLVENKPNPEYKSEKINNIETTKKKIQRISTTGTVGIFRDQAFNFYYPENIESLKMCADNVIEINSITDTALPDIDFLYIGGGFPETQAKLLEKNTKFMKSLKHAVENGLKVYAECGGLVYLGMSLIYRQKRFSMTGIFPVHFDFSPKPRGHGYTCIKIVKRNPFFKVGTVLKGHEFHYTYPVSTEKLHFVGEVNRGYGFNGRQDCIIYKNVFALYTHIHAQSMEDWGKLFLSG